MKLTTASRALMAGGFVLYTAAAAHAQSAAPNSRSAGYRNAYDRLQPPVSESNGYIVYRALDASRLQRDTMVGPTNRMFVSIAETSSAATPNEITVTGTADGKKLVYTIRVDGAKHRVWSWTEDGVKSVENGVWTEQKYEMPWLNKCG